MKSNRLSSSARGLLFTIICAGLLAFNPNGYTHTCPGDATATGVGVTVAALRTNGVPIGTGFAAPCEPILLQMSIVYIPVDPITGGNNAAFDEGQMIICINDVCTAVTPPGPIPLIGGDGSAGCNGLNFYRSLQLPYTVTEADALAGSILIKAIYTNGNAHIGPNNLNGVVSGTQGFTVRVRPSVSCEIAPGTIDVCQGGSATFTASGINGSAPYSFQWRGPNNFSASGATITINNAQPANAGIYTATITDAYGCTNTCTARLIVRPLPTCDISGPATICHPSTNSFTSTVNPPTPGVTYLWTIGGPGQIVSANNQATVVVVSTGSGSIRLTNRIVLDGCTNFCTTTVTARPCEVGIRLTKEIVCWTPTGCDAFDGSDSAIGVLAGNQCPAFCYRITVANASAPGIELRNLVVTDNELDLSACNFPSTLGVIGSPSASFSCIISNVTHCSTVENTVTASGTGVDVQTGETVRSVNTNDSAIAVVVPLRIVCEKLVFSPADLNPDDGPDRVTLPPDGGPFPVTYGVAVSNASSLPVIAFILDPALANCPLPPEFTNGTPLAPFERRVWPNICTANLSCGIEPLTDSQFVNTITVMAMVDISRTNVCNIDHDGDTVVASSTCDAVVECPAPGGCRVTGGGRQDTRQGMVFPLGDPAVRYVTHGGQVGAPVGNETAFDPNSECIQGQWEHVRHFRGGRRANFHANTFDSLGCACLGCPENPAAPVIGELCNAGDRVCGPEPRKAPANKICFSGVGNYTDQRGRRRPFSVIFRVDIEDRSEPGGSHPGGATDPADRYRIRIWKITGDPDSPQNLAMRRAIACTPQSVATRDGVDVPLGTPVFGLPAPDVDDGGELLHGNHQIHPQIKPCP